MADGQLMRATTNTSSGTPLSLDDAIARLEADEHADLTVDLGNGRIAKVEGARGTSGLLQRLRGHRMLMALATGAATLPRFKSTEAIAVSPEVKVILDAVYAKR
jgi:hypothetical protein